MALDEPKANDVSHNIDGLEFLIGQDEEEVITSGRGVRVDHVRNMFGEGFSIEKIAF